MLFAHFLEKDVPSSLLTYQVQLERTDYLVKDLLYMLRPYRPQIASPMTLHLSPTDPPLNPQQSLCQLGLLNDSVFILYQAIKPISSQTKDMMQYIPLIKYSFEEADMVVKVYVDLVGASSASKVTKRFLEKSLEVRLEGVLGKNYIFAVPNTQCRLNPDTSKVVLKEKRMIIHIGKIKKEDNWFSVYKQRTIGGGDD